MIKNMKLDEGLRNLRIKNKLTQSNIGKIFLLDYMISLLHLPDYINKNEAQKNLDKKIIKKLYGIIEQFNRHRRVISPPFIP